MFRIIAMLGLLLIFQTGLNAAPLRVGNPLPQFTLENQFGKTKDVVSSSQLILFSSDKASSEILKAALSDKDQAYLDQHQIQVVADISGMPAIITKMFAMPKLRKRTYDLLLSRDETVLIDFPRQPNSVTALTIKDGAITEITFHDSAENLTTLLP